MSNRQNEQFIESVKNVAVEHYALGEIDEAQHLLSSIQLHYGRKITLEDIEQELQYAGAN